MLDIYDKLDTSFYLELKPILDEHVYWGVKGIQQSINQLMYLYSA